MQSTENSNTITLRGSTDIVTEFFMYSVNSILYQRAIYPPELFKRVSQYGLPMMVTTDDKLNEYIANIMKQLNKWLLNGNVQQLVLVVKGVESGDTLERWKFNCQSSARIRTIDTGSSSEVNSLTINKTPKEITQEIQAIIRQITACVTFLPLLSEPCSFDLLVYTDADAAVPAALWEDSDPCCIINSEDVKLRSFTTKSLASEAVRAMEIDMDSLTVSELVHGIEEIQHQIIHLKRSQNELKEYILTDPDIEFVTAIDENEEALNRKQASMMKFLNALKVLDPTLSTHYESSIVEKEKEKEKETDTTGGNSDATTSSTVAPRSVSSAASVSVSASVPGMFDDEPLLEGGEQGMYL